MTLQRPWGCTHQCFVHCFEPSHLSCSQPRWVISHGRCQQRTHILRTSFSHVVFTTLVTVLVFFFVVATNQTSTCEDDSYFMELNSAIAHRG